MGDRLRLLRAQDDPKLLEHVALNAPEPELRLAAFQRVERMPFIVDRVTNDSSAELRKAALERVSDESQLLRISERARKSDKEISRLAAERVQTLRIERGDADAITAHARQLCEQMERMLREGAPPDAFSEVESTWSRVADRVPAELLMRFGNARDLHQQSRNPQQLAILRQRAADRAQFAHELEAIERLLRQADATTADDLRQSFSQLAELHDRIANGDESGTAGLSTRFAQVGAQIAALPSAPAEAAVAEPAIQASFEAEAAEREASRVAARQARADAQKQLASQLQIAIGKAASAIESGQAANAHAAHAQIVQLRRKLQSVPASLHDDLAEVERNYARLSEWQSWSDGNRRHQLLEELEKIPALGMHPDALATRVRELQAEWESLNRTEARASASGNPMDRRFHALCRQAFAPVKPYFEKRTQLRKQGAEQVSEFIERARATLTDADATPAQVLSLRQEAARELHGLDRVDPRERKTLAAELKQILSVMDERIKTANAQAETDKEVLIKKATALAELSDTRQAISQARDLQKKWQAIGKGRQNRDQTQWKTFRTAIDSVFSRADSERAEQNAKAQDLLARAARVCADLDALATATDEPERSAIQALEATWRELDCSDAALRRRFQTAQESLRTRAATRSRRERRAAFESWVSHYQLLRRLERGEMDAASFNIESGALANSRIAEDALQSRADAASGNAVHPIDDIAPLLDCVLEMETLAGIEPPEVDRQRRLDLQMEKLSARMRGQPAAAPEQALHAMLVRWLELGPAGNSADSLESRFLHALNKALDTIS